MKKFSTPSNSQWSSKEINPLTRATMPNNCPTMLPDIKEAFLPSSLDLTFTLSFQR